MYKKVRHLKKQLNCGDFFALVSMKIEHCTQPIERRGRQENGVEKRGCLPSAACILQYVEEKRDFTQPQLIKILFEVTFLAQSSR